MKPEGFTAPKFSWRNGGWPQSRKKGHRHAVFPHKIRRSIRRHDAAFQETRVMQLNAREQSEGR